MAGSVASVADNPGPDVPPQRGTDVDRRFYEAPERLPDRAGPGPLRGRRSPSSDASVAPFRVFRSAYLMTPLPLPTTLQAPNGSFSPPGDEIAMAPPQQGAASLWPEQTRPSGFHSSFGPSVLGPEPAPAPVRSGDGSAFDVCHVGVVLRAVLLVQGVVALGVMYLVDGPEAGLALFARGSLGALWGVLVWLVLGCLGKRWLSRLSVPGQWAAAVGLGAGSAALASSLLWFTGLTDSVSAPVALAPVASGAAIAAALFYWLRLRAQAQAPADANARLAELQSRIRPHFLFNTLNTAVTLVRVDPARAEAVLEDLAQLFRVALSEPGESVSLADEIELARRYLAIEQLRFGNRLRVTWDLDAEGERARVPPLLLQPLVENAVRHGIEPVRGRGQLRVRTRVQRGSVVIDIVNPVGERPAVPGNGIALRNVRERLRLMHDVAAQFDARREGDVFRVQVVVPLA